MSAFFQRCMYICNKVECCGEKKYIQHCSLQFSCWRLAHSCGKNIATSEKDWEKCFTFFRGRASRVLRKAFGAFKSLIHCVGYRDSPGIQIAISLTTDTVESRSLNWQMLTWIFSHNESIIIYILVNLYKERNPCRNYEVVIRFSYPDDSLLRVSLKSWRSERIVTTYSIQSAKFRTVHSVSL